MATTSLSRSGVSSPLGKADRRLDILVSEDLENAIITTATLKGVGKSEFVRSLLERVMFGEFAMLKKMAGGE